MNAYEAVVAVIAIICVATVAIAWINRNKPPVERGKRSDRGRPSIIAKD